MQVAARVRTQHQVELVSQLANGTGRRWIDDDDMSTGGQESRHPPRSQGAGADHDDPPADQAQRQRVEVGHASILPRNG